ncbi:MotA/TolQ/ExbB proton channel family protein [Methylosinus sp. Sm6]|uniref:MotA/TolQ/ExbB proton channel family protein n=1 Tax=Methylosinus sp. Sm6 TaxID=2866948 RepID=UPI001C9924AE|nr:MotA/TolQ/ExbB proton channel family protein [Methylosinus sp. Sm6]MBY6239688.1 MotA/TolQ/ExbB proton channel family protein [Methylosinus sp. Sm6]
MSVDRIIELAAGSGGILYLMPLMLLLALTVSFERSWCLAGMVRRCRAVITRLSPLDPLDRAAVGEEIDRLREGSITRILRAARETPDLRDRTLLQARIEEAILQEVPAIDRSLWLLDTIVTLAPLLGLLGTIIGMFNSFQVLGKPGSSPTDITAGVAEALIATAAGLLIAIVGVFFFNSVQTRVRLHVHQLETLKMVLVNRMTIVDESAACEAPPFRPIAAAGE